MVKNALADGATSGVYSASPRLHSWTKGRGRDRKLKERSWKREHEEGRKVKRKGEKRGEW